MSDGTGPMNLFDLGKAYADFWALGGQALLQAQQNAGRMFTESLKGATGGALPTPPELGGGTAEVGRASQAMAELWSEAVSLSGTLAAKLPAGGEANTPAATALRNMLDPKAWLAGATGLEEAVGRAVEGPRLADLWDVERRYARVLQAWLDVRRRALEHNAVVMQAWLQAGRQFSEELAGRTSADGRSPDARALLALWTETANRVLLEAQRSETFLETQAAQIRASTELRMAQGDLVEYYGDRFGFPTRTELDDVHRTVTELRREMRALRRRARQQDAPVARVNQEPRAAGSGAAEGGAAQPGGAPLAVEPPPADEAPRAARLVRTAKVPAARTPAAKPSAPKPAVAQPPVAQPSAPKPTVAQPPVAQPSVAKSPATKASVTKASATKSSVPPAAAPPASTGPGRKGRPKAAGV